MYTCTCTCINIDMHVHHVHHYDFTSHYLRFWTLRQQLHDVGVPLL